MSLFNYNILIRRTLWFNLTMVSVPVFREILLSLFGYLFFLFLIGLS